MSARNNGKFSQFHIILIATNILIPKEREMQLNTNFTSPVLGADHISEEWRECAADDV